MSMQVPSLETTAVRSSIRPAANEEVFFDVESLVENFDVLVASHGGPDQVRRLVVELAVRGRLTNAQSGDDDVEMLIVRIARDVGDRAAKYPPVEAADEPFTIPAHWKWVRWGHLSTGTSSGWSPQCENRSRGDNEWGVLKVSAVSWNQFNPEENKALPKGAEPRPEFAARSGDFLMSRANTAELVGRCVIVGEQPERLLLSDKIVRCEFSSHVEKRYVALFNRSMCARAHYVTHASGTSDSMKNISRDVILGMAVPLPPLAEQKRIVAKVEQLMALCDDLEARQKKKREVSTRLTKSALEALTMAEGPEQFDAAWKRVVENFDALIDRSEKVGDLRKAIRDLSVSGRVLPGTEQCGGRGMRDDGPFAIPASWDWQGLGTLAIGTVYGTSQKAHEEPHGVPVLRMNNIQDGRLDLASLKYVPRDTEKLDELLLIPGDLLFNRTNSFELVGKMAVFRETGSYTFASYLIRVRLDLGRADPEFINLYFGSSACRRTQIEPHITRQTNQANFNGSKLKDVLIPTPPLTEQKRIVARVKQLMAVCDALEERFRRAERRAGRLVEAAVSELVG